MRSKKKITKLKRMNKAFMIVRKKSRMYPKK